MPALHKHAGLRPTDSRGRLSPHKHLDPQAAEKWFSGKGCRTVIIPAQGNSTAETGRSRGKMFMENGNAEPESKRLIQVEQTRKPYTKPAFRFEQVFVTSALTCTKTATQPSCGLGGVNSAS